MIEVDILIIKQIDLKYLSKIRKLLNLIMQCAPCTLNVSQLSEEIQTSRSTVMNYLKYLTEARLLNLLYEVGESYPKKPKSVFPQNTNIMHALVNDVNPDNERRTFLYNSLLARHKVNIGRKHTDFLINNSITISYKSINEQSKTDKSTLYAVEKSISDKRNEIPIWMFGFLY